MFFDRKTQCTFYVHAHPFRREHAWRTSRCTCMTRLVTDLCATLCLFFLQNLLPRLSRLTQFMSESLPVVPTPVPMRKYSHTSIVPSTRSMYASLGGLGVTHNQCLSGISISKCLPHGHTETLHCHPLRKCSQHVQLLDLAKKNRHKFDFSKIAISPHCPPTPSQKTPRGHEW